MTALQTPAPDAHASEWGALAVSIPGWRWVPGMAIGGEVSLRHRRVGDQWNMRCAMLDPRREYAWPDPDDPATAGCLLALLAPPRTAGDIVQISPPRSALPLWTVYLDTQWELFSGVGTGQGGTLGRACIAAAVALGRWPGGDS